MPVMELKVSGDIKKKMLCLILMSTFCFLAGRGIALIAYECKISDVSNNVLKSSSWGLSFQNEGNTPVGNESKEDLKEQEAYFVGNEENKKIYLTFDAGYENGNMMKILEALKKHNVTATFFVVGSFIENNKDLVVEMESEGHNIANHSFSHPDMSVMTKDEFENEITKLEDTYRSVTGKELTKFYRPPQGKYSKESIKYANELGYKTIFWSLAYVDWYEDKQPLKEEAIDILTRRIHPGAIVLLHSTSATNAEILDELLTKWESMGYTFGNLNELDKDF